VKLIDACQATGVRRYVMVSSIGAHEPERGTGAFQVYLEAKAKADQALIDSGLEWTVVRPGSLTNEPGTGLVRVSKELGGRDKVPRDDVAAVLAEVLIAPNSVQVLFELFTGDVPIPEAIRSL